jgi:hypothetical protein
MMERYDTRGYKCGGPSNNDCMEKDPEGDYVLYSDAEAVEREKDEELAWMMNRNIDLERMWNASERYAKHCVTTIEETEAALAAAQGEVERCRQAIPRLERMGRAKRGRNHRKSGVGG